MRRGKGRGLGKRRVGRNEDLRMRREREKRIDGVKQKGRGK
jgi:hypothetical protein